MTIRLLISVVLYLLYVWADFTAMAYLAYNEYYVPRPHEPAHGITLVVAILFLGYNVLTILVLEWIWNHYLSLQDYVYSLNQFSWYNAQRPAIRLMATILLWFASFALTTYMLWQISELGETNDAFVVIMFILLFTLVPMVDLFMSWLVRRALGEVCCHQTRLSRQEGTTELSQQQAQGLLVV